MTAPVLRRFGTSALSLLALAAPAFAQLQAAPPPRSLPPAANPVVVTFHGSTVAALPDINGDGVPDIAVGSYFSNNNQGRVYIYSGANGQLIRTIFAIHIEEEGFFGAAISAVPDVNGDGVPDIIIGAPHDSPGPSPSQNGRVYIYSGATGQFLHRLIPAAPVEYGQFGYTVAGIQDVDGDGFGDVVVGAPYERSRSSSSNHSGRVHIYSGRTGQRIRSLHSPGEQHDGHFGEAVAVIRDLDGDGYQDIIVGSPKERPDRAGRVYVYSGRTGRVLLQMIPPAPQFDMRFGAAVAAVPDVDGDGFDDILVGAPRTNNREGRAFLYSGRTGQLLRRFQSPGGHEDGRFGYAVAGIPDVTGDGRGDVLIGAPHENPGNSPDKVGRAYIYDGATGRLYSKLLPPSPIEEEHFGHSVAGLPDTNANGRGEVLVGAPGDDSPSHGRAGRGYHFRY
jgi:hypothetical protein